MGLAREWQDQDLRLSRLGRMVQVPHMSRLIMVENVVQDPQKNLDRGPTTRKTLRKARRTPPTIGVMFVDQTKGGVLARRLQEVEDMMARVNGYRIRMV